MLAYKIILRIYVKIIGLHRRERRCRGQFHRNIIAGRSRSQGTNENVNAAGRLLSVQREQLGHSSLQVHRSCQRYVHNKLYYIIQINKLCITKTRTGVKEYTIKTAITTTTVFFFMYRHTMGRRSCAQGNARMRICR